MTIDSEVAAPEKASRWEDFIDVIFSPGELFDRRAHEGWLRPFIILCVVTVILYYILMPVTGVVWDAAMSQNAPPNATPEQLAQSARMMRWLGGLFVPFGYLFAVAGSALFIKLISSLLEPAASWRQSFLVATYAMFITLPQSLLAGISVFIKSTLGGTPDMRDMSFGALRFAGADTDPVMRTLLGRFELFAIWLAVLIAIGLMHVVGMSRGKAFATAAIVWALAVLPGLVGSLFTPS